MTALVHRLADQGGELLVLHLPPGDSDDDEALGHQSRIREVEHPREELSPREVTGRSEEDDHVILGDGRRRGDHGRLCGLDAHCGQFDVVPAFAKITLAVGKGDPLRRGRAPDLSAGSSPFGISAYHWAPKAEKSLPFASPAFLSSAKV